MKRIVLLVLFLAMCGCKSSTIFTDIGTNIASPSFISINAAGDRLYVVNSNDQAFYEPEQGSLQTYELSLNGEGVPIPSTTAVKSVQMLSLSSEMYIDAANKLAYLTNRHSADSDVTQDSLFTIDFDEASADYLNIAAATPMHLDPYGVACCYPTNRLWITTENYLQYVDLTKKAEKLSPKEVDMRVELSEGSSISDAEVNFIKIISWDNGGVLQNQAYISRLRGGVYIVNLDEVDMAGKQPVDYFLDGISEPRDIASDGKYIYILNQGVVEGDYIPHVLVVDPTKFPSLENDEKTQYVDMNLDSDEKHPSVIATPEIEEEPQRILITTDLDPNLAFITCKEDNKLSVVNTTTREKQGEPLDTGEYPYSMAFYPAEGAPKYLFVGNLFDNSFTVVKVDPNPTVAATHKSSLQ